MRETLSYLNGRLIPAAELAIPVHDAGFVLGVTVAEQLRTFDGRLFRLDNHLRRLARSLDLIGVSLTQSTAEIGAAADELARRNHELLDAGDDLGLSVFVTPGAYPTFVPLDAPQPTIGMHTYPIPFRLWAHKYQQGERLNVSRIRQVSPRNWPPELKCRSRMHYYLADREARVIDPTSRALLLDLDGFVSEASTANVLAHFESEGLVSPPQEDILPGISLAVLGELASQLSIPLTYRRLSPDELATATEVLLCSTSPCLLPVASIDQRVVGDGRPGPIFARLIKAWSELVGVDIMPQAQRFSHR